MQRPLSSVRKFADAARLDVPQIRALSTRKLSLRRRGLGKRNEGLLCSRAKAPSAKRREKVHGDEKVYVLVGSFYSTRIQAVIFSRAWDGGELT